MLSPLPTYSILGLVTRNLLITSSQSSKPRSYIMAFDGLVPEAPSLQSDLMKVKGVKKLSISPTGVTVTVRSQGIWPSVRSAIEDKVYAAFDPNTPHTPNELRLAIQEILNTGSRVPNNIRKASELLIKAAINPFLARDGGSCSYERHELTDKGLVVYIKLHGNCSGCSKSTTTMNTFVISEFKRYIPDIHTVKCTNA
ncbi:Hypothetical protein GLP15_1091 [Giardia lamblia P15]|uniref:NIF system FeS cluster assembly NifU C-terminal domain-containing protein n=1 Tax=Giardia intestinalis (strain P15) TaxID=658858 RepID=E1F2L0_GIAIA|nr:Hypothetical protein GLP15_1091 [Giardia lamblia P15]